MYIHVNSKFIRIRVYFKRKEKFVCACIYFMSVCVCTIYIRIYMKFIRVNTKYHPTRT